jgi:hypothetical protein
MITAAGPACSRRRDGTVRRAVPALLPRRGGQRWLDDHPPGITHVGLVARLTAAAAGTTRAAPTRHRPGSRFWALHRRLAFLAFRSAVWSVRQPRRPPRKALGIALARGPADAGRDHRAEQELFNKVWYVRGLAYDDDERDLPDDIRTGMRRTVSRPRPSTGTMSCGRRSGRATRKHGSTAISAGT